MSDVLKGFIDGLFGTSQATNLVWLGTAASRIFVAIVIAAITLVVAVRIREGIGRGFKRRRVADPSIGILIGRACFFAIVILGVYFILRSFGLDLTALVAVFGAVSLAVSLAIQDVLKNVVAGVYLLIERPFRPGETIMVRTFVGVVESIDLRTTTLRTEDELVYVPNAILLAEVLINRGIQTAPIPKEATEQ